MERSGLVLQHQPVRDHPDAASVIVDGSIDPKTVNRLKDTLDGLAAKGTKRFFLDCAKLTYVNSSGLAYLLNLAAAVKAKDGMVALAAVDSKILVIFNMMGITSIFQFYKSTAEALQALDEKVARELRDVGPALKLEEPPKPAATPKPRPAQTTSTPRPSRLERVSSTRIQRTIMPPPPPENAFLRFLRELFGIEDTRTFFRRRKMKR